MPENLYHEIVLALTPPVTLRSMENLRRTLEDMYVRSTAQGATPEDAAAFNPKMILMAHEAAMRDNAKTIAAWASAIYQELHAQQPKYRLNVELENERGKLRHFNQELEDLEAGRIYQTTTLEERERHKAALIKAIQRTSENVFKLTQNLRGVPQPQATVPGYPPSHRSREASPEHQDLDGSLSNVPSADP